MRINQINESKQMIVEGFFLLLKDIEYKKITISEIARAAEVSRMTLYRHFNTIEEIFFYYISTIHEAAMQKFLSSENQNFRHLLLIRHQVIYDNEYFRIILANDDVKLLLFDFTRSIIHPITEDLIPVQIDSYTRAFVQGGINQITEKWLLSDMKETPEEITDIIVSFLRKMILS